MLQLFVFQTSSDTTSIIQRQEKALNNPAIFNATTMVKDNTFGHYSGKGILMDGVYEGGVIKGNIKIFCFSEKTKSFLVIRQIIGNSVEDKDAFIELEKSFKLR